MTEKLRNQIITACKEGRSFVLLENDRIIEIHQAIPWFTGERKFDIKIGKLHGPRRKYTCYLNDRYNSEVVI